MISSSLFHWVPFPVSMFAQRDYLCFNLDQIILVLEDIQIPSVASPRLAQTQLLRFCSGSVI